MATQRTVPQHWEKRILAAYLLMMGRTWKAVSAEIGRTEKTIANWKNDTYWWQKAREEAEKRWLYDVKDAAREAVYGQIRGGDGDLGLKILERLTDELAPPKQKHDVDMHKHGTDILVLGGDKTTYLAALHAMAGQNGSNGH